jgi:signal transduction histidine kinase/transcriptional regulator with GAF, ATPase, and Fis domain
MSSMIKTIHRDRAARTSFIVSRTLVYGLTGMFVVIGYALMVTGLEFLFQGLAGPLSPFIVGISIFIITLLVNPIRQKLQSFIDRMFLRGGRAYEERLQTFSGELTHVVIVREIIQILSRSVERTLLPTNFHIFIYDPLSDQYIATSGEDDRPTSDLRFAAKSDLVHWLNSQHRPVDLDREGKTFPGMQADLLRLKLLNPRILASLSGRQSLTGWLALGERLSGEAYTHQDLIFLDALCDQSTLAIERAQVVANMESRVREMNVLARVAQGINITLSLDDILELIYAQTSQVIPADDFHFILEDKETHKLEEIFCVEKNERLMTRENKSIMDSQVLEPIVLQQRKAIFTDDFSRACQLYGILIPETEIYAWMGVPLNSGAETIGVLSLAKRDLNITYSPEQLNLFQAIADQAAGAIVKARLLQESEKRARQLTTLHEVTRKLTSFLEVEPLLNNILESAVQILNCQAGNLLMLDNQKNELVYKVIVGPQPADLLNSRISTHIGLIGEAFNTRQGIIVNNLDETSDLKIHEDMNSKFTRHFVMVVPMQVKDDVIGVIEVINRLDRLPFDRDDFNLLSAFAAQSSVAVENARLYTMTDQALAAKVEELSIMQRIDRELNASLDLSRAIHITLEWAMRQSGASAGLVGLVQEDVLKIEESLGYGSELEPYRDSLLPFEGLDWAGLIETGLPRTERVNLDDKKRLLSTAYWQIVIPLRRETITTGVVYLESTYSSPLTEDQMNFLLRLSDHASIAISNAQFYAAVQAANLAKSDFVSFVSHELKNPMTSIKGYTELLAAGAVGPITEPQANFLATIRSNVERMATLVSDLADVSRIEAGRLKLDFKAISTKDVVEEAVRSLRRQIEEKNQSLVLNIADDVPNVWADRTRFGQIITNLISNACKYTPSSGQITISAEICSNQWDQDGAPQVMHMKVTDNGIGLSPEDQKKIFQKFFRSEDPKTRESPGTGLGLNITRSLVEYQGGKIWFESEFRKGTTFHFTIPVAA